MPSTSPSSKEKETPFSAFTSPAGVKKERRSSLISSSFSLILYLPSP